MKRKEAVPGKPIVMKLRDDEEDIVCKWLDLQSFYGDSIRYLIQQEIAVNGLRNLQQFIPQHRTVETLKSMLPSGQANLVNEDTLPFPGKSNSSTLYSPVVAPVESMVLESSLLEPTLITEDDQITHANMNEGDAQLLSSPSSVSTTEQQADATVKKRSAGKKFGSDVVESFMN